MPAVGTVNARGYVWDGTRWQAPAGAETGTLGARPGAPGTPFVPGLVTQPRETQPWNVNDTKSMNAFLKNVFTLTGGTVGSLTGNPAFTIAGASGGRTLANLLERAQASADPRLGPSTPILNDAIEGAIEGGGMEIAPAALHGTLKYGGKAAQYFGPRLSRNAVTGTIGVPLETAGELATTAADKMGPGTLSTRMAKLRERITKAPTPTREARMVAGAEKAAQKKTAQETFKRAGTGTPAKTSTEALRTSTGTGMVPRSDVPLPESLGPTAYTPPAQASFPDAIEALRAGVGETPPVRTTTGTGSAVPPPGATPQPQFGPSAFTPTSEVTTYVDPQWGLPVEPPPPSPLRPTGTGTPGEIAGPGNFSMPLRTEAPKIVPPAPARPPGATGTQFSMPADVPVTGQGGFTRPNLTRAQADAVASARQAATGATKTTKATAAPAAAATPAAEAAPASWVDAANAEIAKGRAAGLDVSELEQAVADAAGGAKPKGNPNRGPGGRLAKKPVK